MSKDLWGELLSHENMVMTYYLMNSDTIVDNDEVDKEDLGLIVSTLESLKGKMSSDVLVDMVKDWKKRTLQDQVEVSVLIVGENHASIFLAYLDVLAIKNKLGVLFQWQTGKY